MAVVVVFPSVLSTVGLGLLNVTASGPRNTLQLTVTGVSVARLLGSTTASSLAQTVNVSISHVNNFQFNWHTNYVYADDVAPILPKGTVLRVTAWHDNTSANKNNPDPNQWVGFGDRTVDEMAHAWVNITYISDEDYKVEMDKRKAKQPVTITASVQ